MKKWRSLRHRAHSRQVKAFKPGFPRSFRTEEAIVNRLCFFHLKLNSFASLKTLETVLKLWVLCAQVPLKNPISPLSR